MTIIAEPKCSAIVGIPTEATQSVGRGPRPDTNTNPKMINFPIPSNDDASKSIECILSIIKQAVAEGLEERGAEQQAKDEEKKEKAKQITEEKE